MSTQGLGEQWPVHRAGAIFSQSRPVAEGALTITKSVPIGYDATGAPPGVPVFVNWGSVGGLIPPPETFTTPIGYVTSAGTRYVWAKIGLSTTAVLVATSLEFVTSTSATGFTTAGFASDGTPPAFMYVPLGRFTATGDPLDISVINAGSGSLVVAMHLANVVADEAGAITSFIRNLSFWRTPDA